jgi:hypothetical protein
MHCISFTNEELRSEIGVHSKANGKIFPVYWRPLLPPSSEQKAYLLKMKAREPSDTSVQFY